MDSFFGLLGIAVILFTLGKCVRDDNHQNYCMKKSKNAIEYSKCRFGESHVKKD